MTEEILNDDPDEEIISNISHLTLQLVPYTEVENITCDPVTNEDIPTILEQIKEMQEIVKFHNGLGIAAPQVGIKKQFYLALINGEYTLFCNAKFFKGSGSRDTHAEGCLSYPGLPHAKAKRWKDITVIYDMVVNGELVPMRSKFKGIEAFEHQHEIDHLNGLTVYMK